MRKFFLICSICAIGLYAKGQTDTATVDPTQPFGKIDKADLAARVCDFEPDANAEVLFDKGKISVTPAYHILMERHTRIKIFNDKGKDQANIRIVFFGGNNAENINSLEAETINLENGNIVFKKIDKVNIYRQPIDKFRTALTFSFPDVRPGSVIEFKYTRTIQSVIDYPDWDFQNRIPTRYSELEASWIGTLYYNVVSQVHHPYAVNTGRITSIAYIPSLVAEPFMTSLKDNADRVTFTLYAVRSQDVSMNISNTWKKLGLELDEYDHFGGQFNKGLKGESVILDKAKQILDTDEKVAYIFSEVKNAMKWDGYDANYTSDGISDAWNKKIGNSTEINLILYRLLLKAGVKVYPMLVSTRENGKINSTLTSAAQFNRAVAYVPTDNGIYVLDATNKYNLYNEIPDDVINGRGFYFSREDDKFELVSLKNLAPIRQMVSVNAEIKADGKMSGTAHITSYSYHRTNTLTKYKNDGEKKYTDYLTNSDNNLKIASLKLENMEVDTLPLVQNIAFNQDLTGSDGNYIYFNTNLFTGLHSNPFLSENRSTDIDFGYCNKIATSGIYKIPAGYKIEVLPESLSIAMPDKGITFKRVVAQEEGTIMIRYLVDFSRPAYFKTSYPELREFFKKMYEMLNEQIVLKKG
ncbi:MAG: DUF3857 domain-containing protein [Mucilaginibacter sp.]